MKKIIGILAILFLFPALCFSGPLQDAQRRAVAAKNSATGPCSYTLKIDNSSVASSGNTPLSDGTVIHQANRFTAPSTFTVKRIIINLKKYGTPAGSVQLWIVDNESANNPEENTHGASVSSDETYAAGDLTTNYAEKTFNFTTGKELTNAATYWIKLTASDLGDSGNFYRWERDTSGGSGIYYSADDNSWSSTDSDGDAYMKVYSCE